jgi:hypothetical protein
MSFSMLKKFENTLLWWLSCATRVFTPRPRQAKSSECRNKLTSPRRPLVSVFLLRDTAVLFLKFLKVRQCSISTIVVHSYLQNYIMHSSLIPNRTYPYSTIHYSRRIQYFSFPLIYNLLTKIFSATHSILASYFLTNSSM